VLPAAREFVADSPDASGSPSQPFVTATAISRRFGAVLALDSVSISVAPGEIVALAGENGSGKSTLARVLSGIHRPDSGEIRVNGELVKFSRPRDALDRGISVVTQEVLAIPMLSVAENILLSRQRRALSRYRTSQTVREAQPLLDEVGLRCDPQAAFDSLKPGEHVLAEIAKALATNPRLLILDEVTTRLGGKDTDRLFAIIRQLRARHVSVIYITHRLEEILQLCDRAVILRDGHLVGEIPHSELSPQLIARMMVGRDADPYQRPDVRSGTLSRLEVRDVMIPGFGGPVSFSVLPGQALGLCGLVGSGRTEILETIVGLRTPLSGKVFVDGDEVRPGSLRMSRQRGISLVPEDRHKQGLLLESPIRMNFSLGQWRTTGIVRRLKEIALARRFAERLGMHVHDFEEKVSTLSGGNQQKVVIGRALSSRPKVLLLDEPTRGVDVGARAEVFEMIGQLLEEGMAIVVASSDMVELRALSHRVLVLHDREAVIEVPASEASEELLALLMSGGS
jgi:rhamnose transport system ATP-binding protein